MSTIYIINHWNMPLQSFISLPRLKIELCETLEITVLGSDKLMYCPTFQNNIYSLFSVCSIRLQM